MHADTGNSPLDTTHGKTEMRKTWRQRDGWTRADSIDYESSRTSEPESSAFVGLDLQVRVCFSVCVLALLVRYQSHFDIYE
jgi:hypothetical protein